MASNSEEGSGLIDSYFIYSVKVLFLISKSVRCMPCWESLVIIEIKIL